MACRNTNDEDETYFMFSCEGKSNHVKINKRKNNSITTMLFTDLYTTLPEDTASKNIHHSDERLDPPKVVVSPKVFNIYYNNYSTIDIRNQYSQVELNLESAIHTYYYNVKFKVSMLVLWSVNTA